MKKMCAFLLLALPLTALAYPIDVSKQFNGSEVSATAVEIDHNMVGLLRDMIGEPFVQANARQSGLFAAASLLCAMAPTLSILLMGRALQGIGSALLGRLADHTSIGMVFKVSAYFPLLGLLTAFLPEVEVRRSKAA